MFRQGVNQNSRHHPLGLRHQQGDIESISIQVGKQLQGCRNVVPAIRARNGRKHLPILFSARLSRISGNWRGSKPRPFRRPRRIRRALSLGESELLPVVRNVPLEPCYASSNFLLGDHASLGESFSMNNPDWATMG